MPLSTIRHVGSNPLRRTRTFNQPPVAFVLVRKSVERNLQITATSSLWRGQTTCRQIYLEGRQHQIWHGQASISLGAFLVGTSILYLIGRLLVLETRGRKIPE
jgi:hypothetical protein